MKTKRIIALMCALCLCIAALYGCAKEIPSEPDDALSDDTPAVNTPSVSTPKVSDTDIPKLPDSDDPDSEELFGWAEPEYGDTKDFVIEIEGTKETVTMTYMKIDFSWRDAPSLSMYVDRERYGCSAFEGEYDIFPIGDPSTNAEGSYQTRIHFFPYEGKTAQEYFDEVKERVADWGETIKKEGTVNLDNHTALFLTTESGTGYFIDYEEGCFYFVLMTAPEAAEGHGARFEHMLRTVEILG